MKKIIKEVLSVFLFTAMIISFASCAGSASESKKDSEPEKEAEKIENELAGKEFIEGDNFSLRFTDTLYIAEQRDKLYGSFTIYKNNPPEPIQLIDTTDIYEYEINTYSYTLDHEKGFIVLKPENSVHEYYKNGKKLYAEPETIPETFEKFKEEKLKFYKALNPDFDEQYAANLYWSDLSPVIASSSDISSFPEEMYSQWLAYKNKQNEYHNSFYSFLPYKLEGSKLVLAEDAVRYMPKGTKFGDIFTARYKYYYYSPETITDSYGHEMAKYKISFGPSVLMLSDYFISINSDNGSSYTGYALLDATNESVTIVKPTGMKNGQAQYDEAAIIICPINYEEGENKVTATVTIEGKNYSFEIKYPTDEEIAAYLNDERFIEVLTEK